jgi:hypothetical protein
VIKAVVLVLSSLVACASPRPPATAPSIPLRCTARPLLDEATTVPVSEVSLALTSQRAVIATREPGPAAAHSVGSLWGTLWDIPLASMRVTRIPVQGAMIAASRGDEVWVVFAGDRSLRFHRVEAGEHDARSCRDYSIGYTSPDLLTVRDDGVFLLAHSYPITEEGTPFGGILAVDRSGVVASLSARGPFYVDAPYLGVSPRKRSTVVLRRAPGRNRDCRDPQWSLLFLDSRLEVEREVLASGFDTCGRKCQPLVMLEGDMVTGCSDGALVIVRDDGQTYETALGRPILAIGALEHQLVVVAEEPSFGDHEVAIESPPGTPIASFGYQDSPDHGRASPYIATSGNDALIVWASSDAKDRWFVHARLLTCGDHGAP